MLWKKVIENGKSFFIDLGYDFDRIHELIEYRIDLQEELTVEGGSSGARQRGNDLFRSGDMELSIDAYNQSILLADFGSEEQALGYANRSACFFKLKRFAMCLVDIDLAKKAKYPVRLMPKLERRKLQCLKMVEDRSEQLTPELSFPPHSRVPCFAECIEIRKSKKYGKHIVTNRDLEIGQTIIVEKAFACVSTNRAANLCCANCFEMATNLVPCRNCKLVMFCSKECAGAGNERFHDTILCKYNGKPFALSADDHLLLLTVWKAMRAFPTIEELMAATDKFHKDGLNDYTDPEKREYFQFFGLNNGYEKLSGKQRNTVLSTAQEFLITVLPHISLPWCEARDPNYVKRFMPHLVAHHIGILHENGYDAEKCHCSPYEIKIGMKDARTFEVMNRFARGIAPNSSLINHSCVPNVCRIFVNDSAVFKVIRPIRKGQQLFVYYIYFNGNEIPHVWRKHILNELYQFECKCVSCTSDCPPYKSIGTTSNDLDALRLLGTLNKPPNNAYLCIKKLELKSFEKSAIHFLNHFGSRHPTDETMKMQFLLTQIWYYLYSKIG